MYCHIPVTTVNSAKATYPMIEMPEFDWLMINHLALGLCNPPLHRFSTQNESSGFSACFVLSGTLLAMACPAPAQYLCLQTAVLSPIPGCMPQFCWVLLASMVSYGLPQFFPGVSRLWSNWQDITHRDWRLSGYFNPEIFLPVCKLPVEQFKLTWHQK